MSLLDFNIKYFENQLTLVDSGITQNDPEKQAEVFNQSDSESSSEYSSWLSSDSW